MKGSSMMPAKSDLGDLPLPVNPVGWDVRFAPGAPARLAVLDNLMKRYREGKLAGADPPAGGPSESSFESSWSSMMAMLTDETERKGPCTT